MPPSHRQTNHRQTNHRLALLALSLLVMACSAQPPPRLLPLVEQPERTPVILVPGITGTELVDPAGEVHWGRAGNLFRPRDGGYGLAVPLVDGSPDPLRAGEVMEQISLAGIAKKPIYGSILDLLLANGYTRGDLENPTRQADLYLFGYDWRRENTITAGQLFERLEALSRVRGEDPLPVTLICQSNGGHICRWLAKYGGASLEEAAAGGAAPPVAIEIERIVFIGTANGGSARILRELHRGRKYLPVVGRKLLPETLFTFRSLYQDLPAYREDLFVDPAGRPLEVDLYQAETWQHYGWSAFAPETAGRMDRRPDLFGDSDDRKEFLQRALDDGRQMQRLLKQDVDGFSVGKYFLIQNVYKPTPDRTVLLRQDEGWEMRLTGDPDLRRDTYLSSLVSAPGDGHAALPSQIWLSPQELAVLQGEPFHILGAHFEMILDRGTHRRLLDFLIE